MAKRFAPIAIAYATVIRAGAGSGACLHGEPGPHNLCAR